MALAEEYRQLNAVSAYDGLFEVREGNGYYITFREHEYAKRKYKKYPLIELYKLEEAELDYYTKCKYGF